MKLNPSNSAIIKRLLVGRNNRPLQAILAKIEPADIASLLSALNQRESHLLIEALISIGRLSQAIIELPESQLESTLKTLDPSQLKVLLEVSEVDEAAYFLHHINESSHESILADFPEGQKQKILQYLSYPEDSAGRLMQTKAFTLPSTLSANEGMMELRKKAQEESIYYIYCVDEEGRLIGVVSLRQLATAPPEKLLKDLAKTDVVTVLPEEDEEEVAKIVAHYDFIAIPVVDSEKKLLGIITVDDVVDIIQEQATANIYAQAGLQEDDRVYTPATTSIKNRLPWMFLNLFLAAIASSVVSLFEETMSQLIILASVKNIVAGIGGNTAIQTLTVVTRGLATEDFKFISFVKAVSKETMVGLAIGIMTGIGAGILIYFWKGDAMVSVVIFVAMVLNSLVASCFGAIIPITLKHFNFDPAIGSGVLVTMITDIFGFFAFLGIATIGLKMVG